MDPDPTSRHSRSSAQRSSSHPEARRVLEGLFTKAELLSHLVDAVPQAVMLKDRQGRYRYVNDYLCRLLGRSRSGIVGKTDVDLFGEEIGTTIREREQQVYENGLSISYRETFPVGGERRTFQTKRVPLRNPEGEIVATIGVCEDVTAEQSIYQEKQQSQATYRSMIDSARDSIYALDADGTILDVNHSMCQMLGRTPGELIGTALTDHLAAGQTDIGEVEDGLQQALEGEPQRLEVWALQHDGTAFPKDLQLQKITYFGSPAVLGIARDITRQKAHEKRLRDAKEKAEEAARLKSAMLANMSHEIRTPLTSIIGFAEVLERDLEGESLVFSRKIRRSGQRLMQTLGAVLDLSKLDSGAYEVSRERTNVNQVVGEAVAAIRLKADQKELRLQQHLPDPPLHGRLDEGAVRRALRNLLRNAVKFTEPGGRVTVQLYREDGEAVLEVVDTGVGMDEAFLPEAFEAFTQESRGTGREYEGTGLGLSISKRLVDALDGKIGIESEKKRGTRVTVRLPLPSA